MLDQNTDRMWYVIGAVIVGAALIFLVNSSFPQLFASVGTTFEDKTTETMAVVDSIVINNENLLDRLDDYDSKNWVVNNIYKHTGASVGYHYLLTDLGLKPGDVITMSGEYDLGKYKLNHRFMFTSNEVDDDKLDMMTPIRHTGKGTFSQTVTVPEGRPYISLLWNNQNYENQGENFTVKVRRMKLEKGSIATPYWATN